MLNIEISKLLDILDKSVTRYLKRFKKEGNLRDDYSICKRHRKIDERGERRLCREYIRLE